MLVALAFVGAVAATIVLEVDRPLPAIALHTDLVFHIERALVLFYGVLLILLPLVRGVGRGELPIELSPRGARYPEVARTAEVSETHIARLESRVTAIEGDLQDQASVDEELSARVDALTSAVRSRGQQRKQSERKR